MKLRDQRDDQACVDYMGFIKGLDKHNVPRLGDVMVPPPQITKCIVAHVEQVVSWFDRKSQVAADEPLHRFQTSARAVAAAPSSNVGLLRFQQIGVGPVLGRARHCARQFWDREGNCGGSAVAVLRQGTLLLGVLAGILDIISSAPF